jgi:hypothetical protein
LLLFLRISLNFVYHLATISAIKPLKEIEEGRERTGEREGEALL